MFLCWDVHTDKSARYMCGHYEDECLILASSNNYGILCYAVYFFSPVLTGKECNCMRKYHLLFTVSWTFCHSCLPFLSVYTWMDCAIWTGECFTSESGVFLRKLWRQKSLRYWSGSPYWYVWMTVGLSCRPTSIFFFGATAPSFTRFLVHTRNDARTSVGRLWTSDQLVAETCTWQHTTLTTDKHSCLRWDSNPQS